MKAPHSSFPLLVLAAFIGAVLPAAANNFQLISVHSPSFNASATAAGDSSSAIISADGRYVLFASAAENLVATSNVTSISGLAPKWLNVFLRDRTNSTTTLVSVNLTGDGGNGNSLPAGISTDGRYVLFESSANDLVTDDTNNASDVFVRDLTSNATALVSVDTNGVSGNSAARSSIITPDGRYVAFVSAANDLVPVDTNGIADVFVRDLQSGTTTLASVGALGSTVGVGAASDSPDITPDSRYVTFSSTATNLVPGVTNADQVYVHDLIAGNTIWASTNVVEIFQSTVGISNLAATASFQRISSNGQFVAFEAFSSVQIVVLRHNLQTGITDIIHTNASTSLSPLDMTPDGRFVTFIANAQDGGISGTNTAVYLWDAQTGTNMLISGDLSNAVPAGTTCESPVITPDGQHVAFLSTATNLTADTLPSGYHLFVRDVPAAVTHLIDADTNGVGAGVYPTTISSMSADGQLVAFDSPSGKIVVDDRNRADDVFVRNLTAATTELISARLPSLPNLTAAGPSASSPFPGSVVSANGRYVAFASDADDLVANDTNGYRDVFVRNLLTGSNILVSVATNGTAGAGISSDPVISGDGRYVAFSSSAEDLVAGDTNKIQDIFVRDLQTGTMTRIVATNTQTTGYLDCMLPQISTNGQRVLFQTTSGNLLFRDLQLSTNQTLTTAASSPSMTPDGRFIAYYDSSSSVKIYVWDAQLNKKIYTNSTSVSLPVSISPDGKWLALIAGSPLTLSAVNLISNTSRTISSGSFISRLGLSFSADGRFLVYATTTNNISADTNGLQDVYLYDFQSGSNQLVSRSYNATGSPKGLSDSPVISPDGRFIAYHTFAANAALADSNDVPDLMLFDRLNSKTAIVNLSRWGDRTANNRAVKPAFSGDSKTLIFQSWASDIQAGDFNNRSDLFALQLAITDSDNDQMDDQWELDHFHTLGRDGTGDFDNDGATDLFEFQTGTDPTDSSSVFRAEILPPATPAQGPTVRWPTALWKSYQVQYRSDVNDTNWQDLNSSINPFGNSGEATDPSPATDKRLYRILLNY